MPVTLHRDLRTAARRTGPGLPPDGAGFTRENADPVELVERGPLGDVWMRLTLTDGQTGAGSGMPNERADCQFGGFPLGERRIVDWIERFPESLPSTTLDRWQVVGPELHGPTVPPFDQALVMIEVGPDKRRRVNANAGRPTTRYRDLGPITIGRAYSMRLDVFLTSAASGWVRVTRVDLTTGERWHVDLPGESIFQATEGAYFKGANYRNAQINGRMVVDWSSMVVWDAEIADALPPMPATNGDTPPPPTPPVDTTPAAITLDVNQDGVWTVHLQDRADTASLLIGIAGDPIPVRTINGPFTGDTVTGAFDRTDPDIVAGRTYWCWAISRDAAGNEYPTPGRPWIPLAPAPPPDPDPDPCAALRLQLEQVTGERDAANAKVQAAVTTLTGLIDELTDTEG